MITFLDNKERRLIVYALGIVATIFGAYLWWQSSAWNTNSTGWNPGTFGDAFGALTSLFSALALIGIYFAYRKETRQVEILLEDRKVATQGAARQEIADTFKAMLETKRMIIEEFQFGLQVLKSNETTVNNLTLRRPLKYGEDVARALYEVQNTWLLLCLESSLAQPESVAYIAKLLNILVAAMSKTELESLHLILETPDLTFYSAVMHSRHTGMMYQQLKALFDATADPDTKGLVTSRLKDAERRLEAVLSALRWSTP